MTLNGKQNGDPMRAHTAPAVLHNIDSSMEDRIRFYATQPKDAISRRIEELDREWDMERCVATNTAVVGFAGVLLSFFGGRKWLILTGCALAYLMMHGVEGWSSCAVGLRRFGIRTRSEIDAEKYALKLLRGDFEAIKSQETQQYPATLVWNAVRA